MWYHCYTVQMMFPIAFSTMSHLGEMYMVAAQALSYKHERCMHPYLSLVRYRFMNHPAIEQVSSMMWMIQVVKWLIPH